MGAKAKLGRREAVAQVNLEGETILELSIQLPECWPLDGAKVECRKGVRNLFSPVESPFPGCYSAIFSGSQNQPLYSTQTNSLIVEK